MIPVVSVDVMQQSDAATIRADEQAGLARADKLRGTPAPDVH